MANGKLIRYYDDAERKLVEAICDLRVRKRTLVKEICDLRDRERALITSLQKTQTIVEICSKIKAEHNRRRMNRKALGRDARRSKRPWSMVERIVLAKCALDPEANARTLLEQLHGCRSMASCKYHLYQFRLMNRSEVEAIANGEAC